MRKKDILFKLEKELKKAEGRQLPNAENPSGVMKGLMKAKEIIRKS